MSYTDQPRDANGRFIPKNTLPEDTVKSNVKISAPPAPPKNPLDEPLVSIQIQNPFKRILYWLNDIRKKQTTTFDFKIQIPLIALPIFLVVLGTAFQAMFNFGRSIEKKEIGALPTPTPIVIVKPTLPPKPILISKLGTIKATYQVQNLIIQNIPTFTPIPSVVVNTDQTSTPSPALVRPTNTPTPTPVVSRYVLVTGSQITFLIVSSNLSLNSYLNQRVLVTGLFDSSKNILMIDKSSDIELMP